MLKEPTLVLLCGLPGSGKSNYAKSIAGDHPEYVIHSSDALRKEMFGDENCQDDGDKVFTELHRRIKEDLRNGKSVIYDACNVHSKRRMAFLRELKNINCSKECHIIATPYEICLRNNWMRERKIPDEVIYRMYTNWQTPWYFEGWDYIKVINNYIDYHRSILYEGLVYYNQGNPHHTKTLGVHMLAAKEYMRSRGGDEIMILAATWHDCGKCFTRSVGEDGVCHYYNHHNVGAYDALSLYDLPLEVSALITYHMAPFFWDADKNPERLHDKYRHLWGDSFYNKVMLLHEADVAAR